jgi:hypothetical protein
VFAPLIVSLTTALAALILRGLARHDVVARRDRYTDAARSVTQTLTWTARLFAVPVLILTALTGITYLVGSSYW